MSLLRVTLSPEPAWCARAMRDACGIERFPRIADRVAEILFPLDSVCVMFAAQAMRAMARHATHPDEPAVHTVSGEGLSLSFIVEPFDLPASEEVPFESAMEEVRAKGRMAAQSLLAATPDAMPGCDVVMCSLDGDPQARRIARAHQEAQKSVVQGPNACRVMRFEVKGGRYAWRATWLRLPPILKLVCKELGDAVVPKFLAEPPPESIRLMVLLDGDAQIFDVDYDPLETKERQAEVGR